MLSSDTLSTNPKKVDPPPYQTTFVFGPNILKKYVILFLVAWTLLAIIGYTIYLFDNPSLVSPRAPRRHLFHVTSGGYLIEGVVFLKGSLKFPFHSSSWIRQPDGKLYSSSSECTWCSKQTCITNGTISVGWYKDDHSSAPSFQRMGYLGLFQQFRSASTNKKLKKENWTTYLRCEFVHKIPGGVEGIVTIPPLGKFKVNPGPFVYETIKGKKAVCVKALFGSGYISLQAIEKFIEYYLRKGFDTIFMYEMGVLQPPMEDLAGVTLIDLRPALQYLYGALSTDMVLFSVANGQLLTTSDCLIQAKNSGYEWVLNVDMDEYLLWDFSDDISEKIIQIQFERIPDPPGKYAVRLNASSKYPLISTCGVHTLARSGGFQKGVLVDDMTLKIPRGIYHHHSSNGSIN